MLSVLKWTAADFARHTALVLAGAGLVTGGLGFATVAAWQGLVLWNGPVAAALVLGAVYAGAGVLLLVLARPSPRRHDPQAMAQVMAAFVGGVEAGLSVRRSRQAPPG